MSFLTKFFIVLHVVLTMLVVSGLVVFVNRVESYTELDKRQKTELTTKDRQLNEAREGERNALIRSRATEVQAAAEVQRIRDQFNQAQTDLRAGAAQLAMEQQNRASLDARLQAATAALQTAQSTVDTLQKQLTETRVASDKTQQQNTELLTANSDFNSRLQVALRNLRNANEELDTVRNELADARDRGGAPGTGAPTSGGGGTAAPGGAGANTELAINGVIRDKRNINGVQYATISVGSSDNVKPGMVFNVIERGGEGAFLGYLTVDRVEPNEATGRLEGPRINEIAANKSEVRTQL